MKAWWIGVLALCSAPAFALPQWEPAGALPASKAALPAHLRGLAGLPDGSVTRMRAGADKAAGEWELRLPDGSRYAIAGATQTAHPNGDVTYSGTIAQAGALYPVVLTVGRDASFGTWRTPAGVYRFESWGGDGWLVDAGHPRLQVDGLEHDFVVPPADEVVPAAAAPAAGKATPTTLDVLFLYSAGFAARYPGTAAQTRTQHLVAVANLVFANSAVDLAIRAVAIEQTAYTDAGDNGTALADMRSAVRGTAVPGLSGLQARRAATGADLVTLMRPHDIETRGSCGIAYLFANDASFGVNVLSDGFDSWSLCDDVVFAHEVGHNLGAEHQLGQSSAQPGYGTAHIVLGRLHTVMGSFGSGTPDRGLRLLRFSNPQQRCGGAPCGTDGVADNARRLRDNMARAAAFTNATSTAAVAAPPAQDPDTDADGVLDSEDAFPHDPRWTGDRDRDGVADQVDAFPDLASESRDLDGDGVGDNADPDRDGDGVDDASDFLPDDRRDSRDRDLDAVGDTTDAFPDNRREWSDADRDGTGDNADADADGDGIADLQAANDLLVVSDGTGRVVRLDGATGVYGGVEWVETHTPQAFGQNGALAWNGHQKRLYGLIGGAVLRFDRAARSRVDRYIASYRAGTQPGMPSGLAAGFAVDPDGVVYVGDTSNNSLQRFDAIIGEALDGTVFGTSAFFAATPREFALTPDGRRLWTIDRAGQLRAIDLVQSQPVASITPTRNGAPVQNPSALAVAADGALLIGEQGNDRVLRVDPAQPQAMTELIASGRGGLDAPAGIAIDTDGRIYVSSAGTDQVLRYAADGTFIGVFSRTPPGALRTPRALAFAPKVGDRFPLDPARAFQPQPGGWNNPQRAGHGLDIQRVGATLAVTWYTYDADGDPVWYLGVGPLQGGRWDAPLLRYRWDGQRATSAEAGRAQLTFASEYAATFDWQLGAASGSEPMQPVQAGTSSDTQFPTAAWYRADQPGWGVALARQGEIAYAIAFYYDRAGEPTWSLGSAQGSDAMTFALGRSHGPTRCPGCSGSAEPTTVAAGELRFDIVDAASANVTVDFAGADVAWPSGTHAFSRLTDTPTEADGDPLPR